MFDQMKRMEGSAMAGMLSQSKESEVIPNNMNANILIVDEEPNGRLMYRSALNNNAYNIYEAASSEDALSLCSFRKHEVAILDLRMPGGMDGLELLQEMANREIETPVVFITAHADRPRAARAMKLGAIELLKKPILPDQLRNVVSDILIRHEPGENGRKPRDLEYYLRCAKRAISLCEFNAAQRNLIKALDINPESPRAMNLVGVMLEMREEYQRRMHCLGTSIS
jgi:DNA-binding NtrC family response regulator